MLAGAATVALLAFPGIASAAVTSAVNAGALTAASDAADPIAITCDAAGNVKVNGGNPGGGPNVACNTITSITLTGGPGDNLLDLSAVNATAFPALTAVTASGGEGNDTILGSQFADRLNGGGGNDRIVPDDNPANTRDDARGDAGNDTIVWNGGDDDDLNDGGAGVDTSQVNGATANETFTVKPGPNGHVIFDRTAPTPNPPGFFNIDMSTTEVLDLNMNAGDDTVTADPGFAAPALDVDGGDGNDRIDGSDAADTLSGGNGDDDIVPDDNPAGTRDVARGDAGNDTITWNGGDDDDINDGGDGNDTSVVNGATAAETFTIKPGAPGRVAFDRVSQNPAPFSVDIGTTELLRLNANAGDDVIKGFKGVSGLISTELNGEDGDDTIRGTDAEDRINAGNGRDLVNSRDRAEDLLDCGANFDVAFVDRRDFLRNCNIVFGGHLRVKVPNKVLHAVGDDAALRLKCAGTKRCKGVAKLRSNGKTLGSAKFNIKKGAKTVHLDLNRKGLRTLANAPAKGRSMKLQIDAKDAKGNGWRSTTKVTLKA
jgi:Ca2+-binding RTX toxin-like protein